MQATMQQIPRATVSARPVRSSRQSTVAVRASAQESRRTALAGLLAGAALVATAPAQAAIDLFDDRKARKNGFDIIYEARDLDLPQNVRDGFTQAREGLADTKKRIKEAEKRIDTLVPPAVEKAYWTEAREELRRQVGTLRFDINAVADTLSKDKKKEILKVKQEFFALVEDLDLELVKKNKDNAKAKVPMVQAKLDELLAKLG